MRSFNLFGGLARNRYNRRFWGVSLLTAGVVVACGGQDVSPDTKKTSHPVAELVLRGEHILTMDGSNVEAVAVTGQSITATGTLDDINRYIGDRTRVVDLGHRALIPGFIDSHSHSTAVASVINLANLSSPPVGDVGSISQLQEALRAHIAAKQIPEGEWVVGYGYDDSLLSENRHPTKFDLDEVSQTHPIAILHVSAHLGVINSMALISSNIDAETPDPLGGHIRRIAGGGEPNGVLEETAARVVLAHVFNLSVENRGEALKRAMTKYASEGFTTVQDGASQLSHVEAIRALSDTEELPLDLVMFPHIGQVQNCTSDQYFEPTYSGGMRVGGVKFVLDGSPQGRTAYLTSPYTRVPDEQPDDYRGYPSMMPDFVNAKAKECLNEGVPMMMHANGDAAIDMAIEALEQGVGAQPDIDHRTVIIHAQLIREDQLDDVKRLKLVPSYYSAHPFFWGDWHTEIFGQARASRISPIRSTIDRDIPFVIHHDAPVIPPMGMHLIHITVNRETRSGKTLGADQKATTYEALYAMTMGGAYQYFEEDKKGSITAGKQADLVILSANPLIVDPKRLVDVDVIETISRGKSVYRLNNGD